MKKIVFLFLVYCLLSTVPSVEASYTLPYPSYMPGNKLYKVSQFIDAAQRYWYFGNIAQVKYHMQLSDKYLVEAKTLFEYKQYLLGSDALKRSTKQLQMISSYIQKAELENKDTTSLKALITDAALVHIDSIKTMQNNLPKTFQWTPEKEKSTDLALFDLLNEALGACQQIIHDVSR